MPLSDHHTVLFVCVCVCACLCVCVVGYCQASLLPALPVSAKQHESLAVEINTEGVMAGHKDPDADAKLAPLDKQRVGYVPLGLDEGLVSLNPDKTEE